MKTVEITRKFSYNGIELGCPGIHMTPNQVREMYAMQYPELNNAVVEGPVTKNAVSTYTFVRAAGAKGAKAAKAVKQAEGIQLSLRERVVSLAEGRDVDGSKGLIPRAADGNKMARFYRTLLSVASHRNIGRPMHMPSQAFGIWG